MRSCSPQFLSDTISWAAIGARTTESQLHRELASGVSFPVGFKNATSGSVGIAIDAMRSAAHPHAFMGINSHGLAAIVRTHGNPHLHVILRGSTDGPNYRSQYVKKARDAMTGARPKFHPSIMVGGHTISGGVAEQRLILEQIDCSHGNSEKDHRNQPKVLENICEQLRQGDKTITGVMIESHFNEGRQDVPAEGPQGLKYGISITDACVDFETTLNMLSDLNKVCHSSIMWTIWVDASLFQAVGARRKHQSNGNGIL